MSIARLKKVSICGLTQDKQHLLEGLQKLGCMHLVPLRPAPAEIEKAASPNAEAAYKALRFLSDLPKRRRQVVRDSSFDVEAFVQRTLDLKQRFRTVGDRREFLVHRIEAIESWGDLIFPPHEELAGYCLWFYIMPIRDMRFLEAIELPWQIVRRDHRFVYAVVISNVEPSSDLLPVERVHVGALPLAELQNQLEDTELELEELAAQRLALTRYIYLLSANLAEAENRASLAYAEQQILEEDNVIAVQGWVAVDAITELETFVDDARLAVLFQDPEDDDEPPTLIEQPENMQAGVDLTMFYQVPAYRDWDPTAVLAISFCIFFAMIIADAGYGLLLLTGLLLFWRQLGKSVAARAYRLFGLVLFVSTIFYGVMVGSYFGLSPPTGGTLAQLQILSVNDFDTMMKLSIIIGVVHICLANCMIAYTNRFRLVAVSKLGWVLSIIGGLILWLSGFEGVWFHIGIVLIGVGLLAILLFSSERRVQKPIDHALRLFDGVRSLGGAMGAFGDVLSYMRLFALGLASASLALTFNDLARDAYHAIPGLGVLAAALIVIVGHVLNLGLSLMSGVVHGLRLNFIEFYKWGLSEEGIPFRRFARKEVQQ